MENKILLKAIENVINKVLDEKLEPVFRDISVLKNEIKNLTDGQEEIKSTQKTILSFISQADREFMKLEEKTKI